MNAAGIPTPNNAGVRPVFPSICSQKKSVEFFWFQTDVAADLEEAFYEVKEINAKTTSPERIFEIRNGWPNTKRGSGKSQYLGSRLFHAEPRELGDVALGLFLMAKRKNANRYDAVANANSGCDLCETTFAGMSRE